MKQKIVKPLVLGLCLSFGLILTSCGTDTSENGSDVESESVSSEDESAEAAADEKILTLDDGTEITLTPVEDDSMGIYGYYTCENDGSMWAFGGDNLAVGYTEEDGSLGTYVCSMEFYQGPEDEDGNFHYCVILDNTLADTSTCWYVMNVLDEDGNTIGLMLQDPGDEDYYIGLTLVDDQTDDTQEEETTETTE